MNPPNRYLVLQRGTRNTFTAADLEEAMIRAGELRRDPNNDRADIYMLIEADPRACQPAGRRKHADLTEDTTELLAHTPAGNPARQSAEASEGTETRTIRTIHILRQEARIVEDYGPRAGSETGIAIYGAYSARSGETSWGRTPDEAIISLLNAPDTR